MAIQVFFQQPQAVDHPAAMSIGNVRASEGVAAGATGSLTAQDGEIAWLVNDASSVAFVAHGGTPDASATVATSATSARYPVASGQYVPVRVSAGDKFAVAS